MKKVKKLRKILFLALASSLLMSLVCVNAFAGSTMYEGTHNGVYYQTRIGLNPKNGYASLQYGEKSLLRIDGEARATIAGTAKKIPFDQSKPKATEVSCLFTGGGNYEMVNVWVNYYVKSAKLETMYARA